MSHFSGIWAEAERIFYLLTDSKCPILFLDNKQAYDAAKWLASKGVVILTTSEPPVEAEPFTNMGNRMRKAHETIRKLRNMADDSAVSRQELVDYAVDAILDMAAEKEMENANDEVRDCKSV